MKIKILNTITFIFFAFILFIFFLGLKNDQKYDTQNLVGNKLPDFNLEMLVGKGQIRSEDLKNNGYTLINFWSSWCGPCKLEHKYLISLKKNTNLKIVGINFKDNKNNALEFLNNLGDPYHHLAKDINGKVSIKFGVYGIPESILVDQNLKIKKKFVGPLNDNDYLEITKHIKKK